MSVVLVFYMDLESEINFKQTFIYKGIEKFGCPYNDVMTAVIV